MNHPRCAAIAFVLFSSAIALSQTSIFGFAPSSAVRETAIETKFKSIPAPDEERRQHRIFTAEPHVAGSRRNYELAEYIAQEWRKQGLEDVVIRRYDVYGTAPKSTSLEMIAPVHYQATLREAPLEADPDSTSPAIAGAWLGMSISGDVTAPVIYAHSGNPEDYDLLRKNGISVKGKIVLVRYSNPYSYRGFKALTAQREGAAAILIYSDPAEDGYKKGKVDPDGPWGPEYHIQRGAITYDFMVPGDPQTPGWASVPGAKRIPIEQAMSAPKIMALPLSWHDAKPLLENMDGPLAPEDWQGGLPIQYHLGSERVKVHLKIEMDNGIQPYYVVEGRIRGAELPDEWVVLGNHRDAWVFGGVDPASGSAAMMEMTRALGQLAKQGMRPRRTIVVCSWDGEEVGLTGSTEWGEQFADELRAKAVAYVNVDEATSGPNFHGQAVASLAPMLVETTRTLQDPSGKNLYDAWKATVEREKKEGAQSGQMNDSGVASDALADTRIGSGSDHTVFLNFVGVPVIGLEFDGDYGVYHSAYDDFFWMNQFGDPGYRYHTLMSQLWGVTALRLANADLLPFDFAAYAANIREFVKDLAKGKNGIVWGQPLPAETMGGQPHSALSMGEQPHSAMSMWGRAPSPVRSSEARQPSSVIPTGTPSSVILSGVAGSPSEAATQSKACPERPTLGRESNGDPVSACATCGPAGSSYNEFGSAPASQSPPPVGKGTASAVPKEATNDGGFSRWGQAGDVAKLDLRPVLHAIDAFELAGRRLNESLARKLASGRVDAKLASALNHGMMQVERNWLNPDGIPGRPWFKHVLYGARFTYAHLELPGLTEAVEKQDWPTARQQAEILERALETNTNLVDELNVTLNNK
jgi:N-acetylated-alpha-linked acidic dipeptidase